MTGSNPAMPPVEAVVCLATQGNLTEEMAQQPLQPELQSPDGNIACGPDMKAEALWYAEQGIAVFPLHWAMEGGCSCGKRECHSSGKHPLTPRGFKDATTDKARISEWWSEWPYANIGMPTGAASGLLVVDVDPRNGGNESLDELLAKHGAFPNTAEQLTGGGGRHIVLRYPGGAVPKILASGIDLKGDGGYIVVAPSLHLSGKRYQWDGIEGREALLHPAELPTWLLHYITEADYAERQGTIPRELPEIIPDGKKHNAIVSLIGTLNKRGVPRKAAFAACRELNFESHVSDEDIWERVESCYKLYPQPANGDTRERDHPAVRAAGADKWPEPEPIQNELPPVQPFYEYLLPDSLLPLVADVAERMQVPMDYSAAVMVLCLAGAVNRRAVIQPKANDIGWLIVPNLWGGIVAPPGFMKSPVIQAVTRPLNQLQTEWRHQHEEALTEYARGKEEYELRRAAWKEQYKAASKKGNAAPDRPDDEPRVPSLRRLIFNDATFEAAHETMSENPAGILVIRDELTGWWSQLDRAGREGERAFCLQAWNGDTGHTIDRIGRGTIHVEACCMSMLGGIQPGRLRSYLVDALKDGPTNDGLIQRFQVLVWPDTAPDWSYVDRAPVTASEEQVARIFRRLVELNAENPARFRFDSDAQQEFKEWLGGLELKIRGDDLHPALISHLNKYRSLMPSLALLFELADRAGSVGFEGSSLANQENFVSFEHTRRAALWCEYLESHARRVYSCVVTPQLRAAGELADKIKHRKLGTDRFFSCRDVYLKGWSGLDSPEAVRRAAEVLQDAGWVRGLSTDSRPFGGRPSNRYEVNPSVWA